MKISGSFPRWAKLLFFGLLGIVFIATKHIYPSLLVPEIVPEVIKDIGIALVVASFLALTIDRWFAADLEREAFEAAIGYIPPEGFKEEIRNLLRQSILCEGHRMTFVLEELPEGDCVRLTTTIERTLKNITSRSAPVKEYLHLDDWGYKIDKAKIIDCYIWKDGQRIDATERSGGESRVLYSTDDVMVAPQTAVETVVKCSEIKRRNDEASFHFRHPTKDPEIVVASVSNGFKYTVGFGPEEPNIERGPYGDRFSLVGMYFPGQRMTIRWWPTPV